MRVEPASLTQVLHSKDGRFVQVEDDVQGVARELRDVDPCLYLEFREPRLGSDADPFWVVGQTITHPDGHTSDHLVLTAKELDQRIVHRIREVASERYDLGAEIERIDLEADRNADHIFREKVGDIGEQLFHAMRKDLGHTDRIYVP